MNVKINTHGNPLPERHGEWVDLFTAEDVELKPLEFKLISLSACRWSFLRDITHRFSLAVPPVRTSESSSLTAWVLSSTVTAVMTTFGCSLL